MTDPAAEALAPLLPCPFCGVIPEMVGTERTWYWASHECAIKATAMHKTRECAVTAWNTRAQAPAPADAVTLDENMRMRAALELIAAPKRPDGTYNRCREACEALARAALRARAAGGDGMIDTERAVKLIQSLSWAVSRYGVISPMMDEECREIIAMLRQSGEDEVQRKARERQSGARLAQWPPDGIDISRPEDE